MYMYERPPTYSVQLASSNLLTGYLKLYQLQEPMDLSRYHVILVDEAQDLSPGSTSAVKLKIRTFFVNELFLVHSTTLHV